MESLKQIFQRIMTKRTMLTPEQRESNGLQPSELEPPKCLKCKDSGFLGYKGLLPGDENFGEAYPCQCRMTDGHMKKRQLAYSELPNQSNPKTFWTFVQLEEMNESEDAAMAFVNHITGVPILVLCGPNGSGKSHLLEAIGRDMLDQDYEVKYVFVPRWLQTLKNTFDTEDQSRHENVFNAAAESGVLLLDDVGRERVTDWTKQELTLLFEQRYENGLLTVVTTKDGEMETIKKQGNDFADRLFDFNSGKVRVVFNSAPSYRTGRVG